MSSPFPGTPISGLPVAVLLDGTEQIPLDQNSTTKRATINQILARVSSSSGGGGAAIVYYVSPTGSDSADGLTPTTAWQTITKVNDTTLTPSTAVLFEGGQTFTGAIVPDIDGDIAAQPVIFGSYGGDRATISSGASNGFYALNLSGVIVRDLIFTGTASTNNGIYFKNTLAGDIHLQNVQAINCDVSGYGRNGIYVFGNNGSAGFDDVLIDGCNTSNCCHVASDPFLGIGRGTAGINVQSDGYGLAINPVSYRNVVIANCVSNDNPGTSDANWTGSGIFIGQTENGLIYNCSADNNGATSLSTIGGGTVGIWTGDSVNIVIDGCISSNTQTLSADGDGFDLEGGSVNCTIRNCYSHDNVGFGYLLETYFDGFVTASDRISLINCVSENDLACSLTLSGASTNVRVYGNTFYNSVGQSPNIRIGAELLDAIVEDNTFIIDDGVPVGWIQSTLDQTNVKFNGNRYISMRVGANITWNSVTYATVAAWSAATGQESNGTLNLPSLISPVFSSATTGLVPASGGGTTTFLRADGGFASPTAVAAPGGSNLEVQYNSGGVIGGMASTVWDKANLALTLGSTATLGVGTTGGGINPLSLNKNIFAAAVGGDTSGSGFFVTQYPDGSNHYNAQIINFTPSNYGEGMYFVMAHGTTAVPLAVATGDVLGTLFFVGCDGNGTGYPWQFNGEIRGAVDGAVSSGVIPTALGFFTGTTSAVEQLHIGSDGTSLFSGPVLAPTVRATTVNATTVNATTGNFSSVISTVAAFSTLNATTASFSTVVAFTANFTTLGATTANFSTANASVANVTTLNVTTANISTLNVSSIVATTVAVTTLNATTVNASTLNISSVANITAIMNVAGTSTFTAARFGIIGTTLATGTFGVVGTSLITGIVGISGTTNITGFLTNVGTANFTGGTFGVQATSNFTGIFGSVGTATFTGTYGVIGTSQFTGITNILGTANITGFLTNVGTAQFTGGSFFVNATSLMTGILGVSGTSVITGTFGVAGTTLFTATFFGVVGTSILTGSFNVIGTSQFTGITNIAGTTNVTGFLTVVGTTNITGGAINFTTVGFNVNGTATFTSATFNVIGTTSFTSNLFTVVGTTNFTGGAWNATTVAFNVNGTALFTSARFGVVGTALFTANLFSVVGSALFTSGAFGVVGTTLVTGIVGIVGSSILTGTLTVSGTTVLTSVGTGVLIANAGIVTSAGGMVLLATLSPNNVASTNNTSVFTSAYRTYQITLDNVCPATQTTAFFMRLATTASDFIAANYISIAQVNVSSVIITDTQTTNILLSGIRATAGVATSLTYGVNGIVNLYNPAGTLARKYVDGHLNWMSPGTVGTTQIAMSSIQSLYDGASSPVIGVNFLFSSGNIQTGVIKIYGMT